MATWRDHKEFTDFEKLQEAIEGGMIWVHRPLIIHERAPEGNRKKCPCGCDSIFAVAIERREHIDVLIDPVTSIRKVLQRISKPSQRDAWRKLAAQARKIELPHRITRPQLEIINSPCRVNVILGGSRGGKTQTVADILLSAALLNGGSGAQLAWVAPTQGKTAVGLAKLALGETVGLGREKRVVRPLIPDELIAYKPSSVKAERNWVELIDGTRIVFLYSSPGAGHMKGVAYQFAVIDECCEVKDKANYDEVNRRLMEAGGELWLSTTPVAGHWLERIYDASVKISDATKDDIVASAHLTAFDNPFVSKAHIETEIARCQREGGAMMVEREIMGRFVTSGPRLWHHFNESEHLLTDPGYRVPSDLGLIDITSQVTSEFFYSKVSRYLGEDFNVNPMASVELQFGYHPKDPNKTPIAIVPDEVVAKCSTIYEHMDRLKARGYAGASVSCDASGAQLNNYRLNHGITDKNSTQAKEMRRAGFDCKPCRNGSTGEPSNPAQLDKIRPLHRLMMERITLPDGSTFPRFFISERCVKTLASLRTQERDRHGAPKKESNTVSDRISGPTDALCYGLFPHESRLFPDETSGVQFD